MERMVQALVFRFLAALAPLVPRHVGLWLFGLPAPLAARLSPSRLAVRDNMRHVVGPEATDGELQRLVTGAYRYQQLNYFDMFLGPSLTSEDVDRLVHVKDREALVAALTQPEGCVVVSLHLGSIELSSRALATAGIKGIAIVERLEPDALFQVVCDLRRIDGIEIVPADRASMPIFRVIRKGQTVFLMADRDTTDNSVEADFFGAPAQLPDGYAQIVRRTGARLVVVVAFRCPDGTLEVHSTVMPRLPVTDDRAADVRDIMRRTLEIAEGYIRRSPEQWVLFRSVWD
jgi:KDO2-lipid IV(A) lauroyltransferase